jgi:hypothetical protein
MYYCNYLLVTLGCDSRLFQGTLTVRNLSEDVIKGVKASAELHQHSMEQEIRELLRRRYGPRSEILRRIRERWKELPRTESDEVEQWRQKGRP